MRALSLCQRVYYTDLWPSLLKVDAGASQFIRYDWLAADLGWKERCVKHWSSRNEADIIEG